MNNDALKNKLILLLQIATVCLFLGRAWQHLAWDAPFRTLLWDEELMKGLVESIGSTSWEEYITSPRTDEQTQGVIKGFGWFYLLCAIMAVFIKKLNRIAGVFMWLGSISLIILAMLYCKERFYSIGQFLEYTLQFSSPLFLYFAVKDRFSKPRLLFYMKLAIALTFICHGLYAIGYYPRPGYFTEMTMNILGVEEGTAIQLLKVAGVLDFGICLILFLPNRIAKWIILYAIVWGFFTTIARVWSYVEIDYFMQTMKQWMHETIYRVPHFMVPAVLYLWIKNERE